MPAQVSDGKLGLAHSAQAMDGNSTTPAEQLVQRRQVRFPAGEMLYGRRRDPHCRLWRHRPPRRLRCHDDVASGDHEVAADADLLQMDDQTVRAGAGQGLGGVCRPQGFGTGPPPPRAPRIRMSPSTSQSRPRTPTSSP